MCRALVEASRGTSDAALNTLIQQGLVMQYQKAFKHVRVLQEEASEAVSSLLEKKKLTVCFDNFQEMFPSKYQREAHSANSIKGTTRYARSNHKVCLPNMSILEDTAGKP
jgi:hypothetical protein